MHLLAALFAVGLVVTFAAEPEAAVDKPSPTPSRSFLVCIDPGHPSENNDGGAVTNGLTEVAVNWEVAVLLRRELEKNSISVVMTKASEKEFVTNKDRAAVANKEHANLFLRLHADSGNSTGFTVYYPRKQGSVRGTTGPSREVLQSSAAAAKLFHQAFAAELHGKLRDNGLRGDEQTFVGGRQGALTGSIFSQVPTVLVEMVFLTTPADAEWIKKQDNKVAMAKALAAGVVAVAR